MQRNDLSFFLDRFSVNNSACMKDMSLEAEATLYFTFSFMHEIYRRVRKGNCETDEKGEKVKQ